MITTRRFFARRANAAVVGPVSGSARAKFA
jgi:hypothetical protein